MAQGCVLGDVPQAARSLNFHVGRQPSMRDGAFGMPFSDPRVGATSHEGMRDGARGGYFRVASAVCGLLCWLVRVARE